MVPSSSVLVQLSYVNERVWVTNFSLFIVLQLQKKPQLDLLSCLSSFTEAGAGEPFQTQNDLFTPVNSGTFVPNKGEWESEGCRWETARIQSVTSSFSRHNTADEKPRIVCVWCLMSLLQPFTRRKEDILTNKHSEEFFVLFFNTLKHVST